MPPLRTQYDIALYGVLFALALGVEAFGVVAFLRVDPANGTLSIRALGPYEMMVAWAALRAGQALAAFMWGRAVVHYRRRALQPGAPIQRNDYDP